MCVCLWWDRVTTTQSESRNFLRILFISSSRVAAQALTGLRTGVEEGRTGVWSPSQQPTRGLRAPLSISHLVFSFGHILLSGRSFLLMALPRGSEGVCG